MEEKENKQSFLMLYIKTVITNQIFPFLLVVFGTPFLLNPKDEGLMLMCFLFGLAILVPLCIVTFLKLNFPSEEN